MPEETHRKRVTQVRTRHRKDTDQDARMGAEWETEWQGYKVHLTETVDPDGPQPITSAGRY